MSFTIESRYIRPIISEFLTNKMVFIGGPRQVGKTTCSLTFLSPSSPSHRGYLNWDVIESQKKIKSGQIPPEPIIILDEIHKFKNWRNLVKGFYDQNKEFQKFIVTGSARLDHYRRGGDSLLGRYRYLRLHPLSIGELKISNLEDQNQLLKLGGFPEPFLNGTEKEWRLWQKERIYRLVNDDIRSLENLREYSSIELLAESLIVRVGSPLSVYSLSQELQFNFRTIESWIKILEQVYYCFRISPFGAPKIRAVKKEKKLYLWDWSSCSHKGARFENMVASHLLKYCHFLEDSQGHSMELRYLRDTDKREVDFVVVKNGKALFAVECKTGESSLSKNVSYFMQRTDVPFFYQVHLGTKDYVVGPKARVLPFNTFCQEEQIP